MSFSFPGMWGFVWLFLLAFIFLSGLPGLVWVLVSEWRGPS